MAGLFRDDPATPEGKYLVQRRDGTVPAWTWFVLGAADPEAPAGLRGYADAAEKAGRDPAYVASIRRRADQWEEDLAAGKFPVGDPDAPRHRVDDPAIIALMKKGNGL